MRNSTGKLDVGRMGIGITTVMLALAAPLASPRAQESSDERGNLALGITAGTLGVGAEAAVKLHPNIILRGSASGGALSTFFDVGIDDQVHDGQAQYWMSQSYEFRPASIMSAGLLLDVHMFRDGGRITGGFRYLTYTLDGKLTTEAGGVMIGDTFYTKQQAGDVTADVKSGSTLLPYLGIGYDSAFFKDYRFSIGIDAGVIIGSSPKVSLNTSAAVSAVDKQAAEAKLEKDLDVLNYYPVLMMTAKYRF